MVHAAVVDEVLRHAELSRQLRRATAGVAFLF
jgi:hypothetical protein